MEHCTTNGNVIRYHLRIIQVCFQPKIGRKIRIFSLGRKNKILIKQKRVYADFDFHCLSTLTMVKRKDKQIANVVRYSK